MTDTQPAREAVPEAFDDVADRYDLMVGLSPGYHRQLRSSATLLVDAVRASTAGTDPPEPTGPTGPTDQAGPEQPRHYLDLGCGSGASTAALVRAALAGDEDGAARPLVLGVDGSAGMLASARTKRWPDGVSFAQGRAEALADQPELGPARRAGGLDGVLAAYLVRNVPDRDAVLRSIREELRPGGVLVVHDYSVRGRPVSTLVWTLVCWGVIIPLGWLTSRRTGLYRYLWRSVLRMDSTAELEQRLRRAGFEQVRTVPVGGWQRGQVHRVVGRAP